MTTPSIHEVVEVPASWTLGQVPAPGSLSKEQQAFVKYQIKRINQKLSSVPDHKNSKQTPDHQQHYEHQQYLQRQQNSESQQHRDHQEYLQFQQNNDLNQLDNYEKGDRRTLRYRSQSPALVHQTLRRSPTNYIPAQSSFKSAPNLRRQHLPQTPLFERHQSQQQIALDNLVWRRTERGDGKVPPNNTPMDQTQQVQEVATQSPKRWRAPVPVEDYISPYTTDTEYLQASISPAHRRARSNEDAMYRLKPSHGSENIPLVQKQRSRSSQNSQYYTQGKSISVPQTRGTYTVVPQTRMSNKSPRLTLRNPQTPASLADNVYHVSPKPRSRPGQSRTPDVKNSYQISLPSDSRFNKQSMQQITISPASSPAPNIYHTTTEQIPVLKTNSPYLLGTKQTPSFQPFDARQISPRHQAKSHLQQPIHKLTLDKRLAHPSQDTHEPRHPNLLGTDFTHSTRNNSYMVQSPHHYRTIDSHFESNQDSIKIPYHVSPKPSSRSNQYSTNQLETDNILPRYPQGSQRRPSSRQNLEHYSQIPENTVPQIPNSYGLLHQQRTADHNSHPVSHQPSHSYDSFLQQELASNQNIRHSSRTPGLVAPQNRQNPDIRFDGNSYRRRSNEVLEQQMPKNYRSGSPEALNLPRNTQYEDSANWQPRSDFKPPHTKTSNGILAQRSSNDYEHSKKNVTMDLNVEQRSSHQTRNRYDVHTPRNAASSSIPLHELEEKESSHIAPNIFVVTPEQILGSDRSSLKKSNNRELSSKERDRSPKRRSKSSLSSGHNSRTNAVPVHQTPGFCEVSTLQQTGAGQTRQSFAELTPMSDTSSRYTSPVPVIAAPQRRSSASAVLANRISTGQLEKKSSCIELVQTHNKYKDNFIRNVPKLSNHDVPRSQVKAKTSQCVQPTHESLTKDFSATSQSSTLQLPTAIEVSTYETEKAARTSEQQLIDDAAFLSEQSIPSPVQSLELAKRSLRTADNLSELESNIPKTRIPEFQHSNEKLTKPKRLMPTAKHGRDSQNSSSNDANLDKRLRQSRKIERQQSPAPSTSSLDSYYLPRPSKKLSNQRIKSSMAQDSEASELKPNKIEELENRRNLYGALQRSPRKEMRRRRVSLSRASSAQRREELISRERYGLRRETSEARLIHHQELTHNAISEARARRVHLNRRQQSTERTIVHKRESMTPRGRRDRSRSESVISSVLEMPSGMKISSNSSRKAGYYQSRYQEEAGIGRPSDESTSCGVKFSVYKKSIPSVSEGSRRNSIASLRSVHEGMQHSKHALKSPDVSYSSRRSNVQMLRAERESDGYQTIRKAALSTAEPTREASRNLTETPRRPKEPVDIERTRTSYVSPRPKSSTLKVRGAKKKTGFSPDRLAKSTSKQTSPVKTTAAKKSLVKSPKSSTLLPRNKKAVKAASQKTVGSRQRSAKIHRD